MKKKNKDIVFSRQILIEKYHDISKFFDMSDSPAKGLLYALNSIKKSKSKKFNLRTKVLLQQLEIKIKDKLLLKKRNERR